MVQMFYCSKYENRKLCTIKTKFQYTRPIDVIFFILKNTTPNSNTHTKFYVSNGALIIGETDQFDALYKTYSHIP